MKNKGLMGAEEQRMILVMLCDDNYGNLRTLQQKRCENMRAAMVCIIIWTTTDGRFLWVDQQFLSAEIWSRWVWHTILVRELWMVNVETSPHRNFHWAFSGHGVWLIAGEAGRLTARRSATRKWVRQQFGSVEEETGHYCRHLEQYTKSSTEEGRKHWTRRRIIRCRKGSSRIFEEEEQLFEKLQDVYETIEKRIRRICPHLSRLYIIRHLGQWILWRCRFLQAGIIIMLILVRSVPMIWGWSERCMEQDRKSCGNVSSDGSGRWYGMGMSQHIDLHTGMKMNAGIQSLCGSYH